MPSTGRVLRGESRFYCPPALRKQQQLDAKSPNLGPVQSEKRSEGSDESESRCSVSGKVDSDSSNLDRFLESTTPMVPAKYLPKAGLNKWRSHMADGIPYFVLGDLWDSFREWSAYGAGVPLMLNGCDSVVQYYVPYLSGIQLYRDPSKPLPHRRKPGEESDNESSRETSSDVSFEHGPIRGASSALQTAHKQQNGVDIDVLRFNELSMKDQPSNDSSFDEADICNPPGQLIFEYLERDPPFTREPLVDKVSILASKFPELWTCRSCDLSPSSWISVAWYPIYRIPTGPTLQNLDACFLTFHSLSTPSGSKGSEGLLPLLHGGSDIRGTLKLPLPTFGLASYRFKLSVWNASGVEECPPKASSLFHAADNWLRLLQVTHPDFGFFVTNSTYWR